MFTCAASHPVTERKTSWLLCGGFHKFYHIAKYLTDYNPSCLDDWRCSPLHCSAMEEGYMDIVKSFTLESTMGQHVEVPTTLLCIDNGYFGI